MMDAPNRGGFSFPSSSSFDAARACRVRARARATSEQLESSYDHVAAMLDQSDVSLASTPILGGASSLASPSWSTASSSLLSPFFPSSRQQQQPTMDLFSPVYPNLVRRSEQISLGGGEVAISESLQSPGQFGTAADWHRRQPEPVQRPRAIAVPSPSPSFVPPPSFPGLAPPSPSAPWASHTRSRCVSFDASAASLSASAPARSLLLTRRGGGPPLDLPRGDSLMLMDTSPGFLARPVRLAAPHHRYPTYADVLRQQQGTRDQNVPDALPVARRRRALSSVSNASTQGSNEDGSSGASSGSSAEECSYCRCVGADPAGHNKHNCPKLAAMSPCRICGASGKYNHTETHCPSQLKTELEFIPKGRRRHSD